MMAGDYGVPSFQSEVDTQRQSGESSFGFPSNKPGRYYYGVSVVTGKQKGAGTSDTGVFLQLIGNKGQTDKVYLQNHLAILLDRDIDRDTTENLIIESSGDLGEVLVVVLGNDKSWLALSGAPWYVNEVEVHNFQTKVQERFPCYHWIGDGDEVSFTAHTTTLKVVSRDQVLLKQRELQLKRRRAEYEWQKQSDWGLPSSINASVDKLPDDEQFERVKDVDFTTTSIENALKIKVQAAFNDVEDIEDYKKIATILGDPEVQVYKAARWTTDVEFGRQVLNGVNPVVIKKCTELPPNFPVTNDMVKGFLNRGLSLEQEMHAGNVYLCDLKIMDGLPTREGQHCAAPICLLYINGSNQLVPIAIQLNQKPGEDNPIFFPSDGWIDWLLAKIYYQSASLQFHQLSTHYFSCHAAMEAYGMATMRNLPDPHPIFKLLRPHFRYTMAINSRARATLINDGGIIDQLFAIGGKGKVELIQRASPIYSVHWTNIERNTKERQVDNVPGYYYATDGIQIWKAVKKFAGEMIDYFYQTDDEVKNDIELQNWAEDIHTNAFPGYFGGKDGHDFPKNISNKEQLVELCTLIMFTGSAQHASVNFGQYDMYGFAPNCPATLRKPPPSKKGEADHTTLLQTLPSEEDAGNQVVVSHLLSRYSQDEIYLGNYPAKRFTEAVPQGLISRFQRQLQGIAGNIEERNKKLDVPYIYMLPNKIPNSITI